MFQVYIPSRGNYLGEFSRRVSAPWQYPTLADAQHDSAHTMNESYAVILL